MPTNDIKQQQCHLATTTIQGRGKGKFKQVDTSKHAKWTNWQLESMPWMLWKGETHL
jgi:hypothetical protein